jgi:uncharacterized repeat protein (TIGR01451 family)
LTVSNLSDRAAKGPIVVTDQMPAGLTFLDAEAPQGWTCELDGSDLRCDHPAEMPAGAVAVFVVDTKVDVPAGTKLTNNAIVAGAETEAKPDNNADDASITVPEPEGPVTDLAITKSARTADTAGNVVWDIKVSNVSDVDAANPKVTDRLPATLKFVKAQGAGWDCAAEAQTVTCDADEVLKAGESAAFTIETSVDAIPGSVITNQAIVSTATAERTADNNTDTAGIAAATLDSQPLGQAPKSSVAFTGANSLRIATGAFALIFAGIALVVMRRRGNEG